MKALACLALASFLAGCASLAGSPGAPERSDALFSRVDVGMTQEQVRGLLGAPDQSMPLRADTLAWDYNYMDSWGYFAVFSVTFDAAGYAVGRISWRINDGGDHA